LTRVCPSKATGSGKRGRDRSSHNCSKRVRGKEKGPCPPKAQRVQRRLKGKRVSSGRPGRLGQARRKRFLGGKSCQRACRIGGEVHRQKGGRAIVGGWCEWVASASKQRKKKARTHSASEPGTADWGKKKRKRAAKPYSQSRATKTKKCREDSLEQGEAKAVTRGSQRTSGNRWPAGKFDGGSEEEATDYAYTRGAGRSEKKGKGRWKRAGGGGTWRHEDVSAPGTPPFGGGGTENPNQPIRDLNSEIRARNLLAYGAVEGGTARK